MEETIENLINLGNTNLVASLRKPLASNSCFLAMFQARLHSVVGHIIIFHTWLGPYLSSPHF